MTTAIAEPKKAAGTKLVLPLVDLQCAMATVALAVERKTTIPVLSSVRVESSGEYVEFAATDLDVTARVRIRNRNAGECAPFLLPALKVKAFARLLQGESVSIQCTEEGRATMRCGRSNTKVPVMPIASFPALNVGDIETGLEVEQAVAERLLNFTAFAISKEESRYTLNGALIEVGGGMLSLTATDGYRLARYSVPCESVADPMLLPAKFLRVLGRVLDERSTWRLRLNADDGSVFAYVPNDEGAVDLASRKMTGSFPNYKAILPAKCEASLVVDAEAMLATLRRCSQFTDERSGALRLTVKPDEISFRAAEDSTGETVEAIDARSLATFEAFSIGFRDVFLVDAFALLSGDVELRFSETNGQNAMMITCTPADGELFEYIIMPMRV